MNTIEANLSASQPNLEKHLDVCYELSSHLTLNPEISGEEDHSSKYIADFLSTYGYNVEMTVEDVPYSFKAIRQTNEEKPKIALLCEYDALPEIGHGCGHSLSCAISILTALTIHDTYPDFPFQVDIIGTPDEELGGGKESLASKGVFDNYEFAIMGHLFHCNSQCLKPLACSDLLVTFQGKSAHASLAPEEGRNALNALQLFFHATDMLRQHVKKDVQMHGVIKEGGVLPSIVPDTAVAHFYPRAAASSTLYDVMEKMENCAKGAAIATGTTYEIKSLYKTYPETFVGDRAYELITDVFRAQKTDWVNTEDPFGSTDMGFIDQFIPTFQPFIKILSHSGKPITLHSKELAEAILTEQGPISLESGAKTLIGIITSLAFDSDLLKEVKLQHQKYWSTK